MLIFNKWIEVGLSYWSQIPCGSPTISKILPSTTIKTLSPAHGVTSFKDRWIGLFYWPNYSGETRLSKQKEEQEEVNVWHYYRNFVINFLPTFI